MNRCGRLNGEEPLYFRAQISNVHFLALGWIVMQRKQIMRMTSFADGSLNFFYFHGMYNGDGFHCWNIANKMDSTFNIFVVHPHGFDGQKIPSTINRMAELLIDEIVSLGSEGPYYLGGFCVGGLIAYEVASLLKRRNLVVGKLIIISSPLPEPSRVVRIASSLKRYCRLSFTAKIKRLAQAILPRQSIDFDGNPIAAERRIAYHRAYRRYRPKTRQREIVCIWGEDDSFNDITSRRRWDDLATSVRTFYVPGDRFCVERSSAQVAEIIETEILGTT